ncbi:MAG: diaminopimelate epimerase [Saprospiraceae bacterium]|jgi:diaminopimelate epimerase
MKLNFRKYQGTGNDFVMIDQRETQYLTRESVERVRFLCDRRFGIGADGLILLQYKEGYDFEMIYFNSDGNESSMCGNGGRCIVAFAKALGVIENACKFLAIDGDHEALIREDSWVELKMGNVGKVEIGEDYYVLDTGSPHYVVFVEDLDDINVSESGSLIRYNDRFRKEGINVNFVEETDKSLLVGTYERGVEDETLSCGTGVTACAIAQYINSGKKSETQIPIEAKGGKLSVRFAENGGNGFEDIWLSGPATEVFRGEVNLNSV